MEEMTAAEMGAFIAKTRKAQNMTQSALAQRLNVTSQAVSRWEPDLAFLTSEPYYLWQMLWVSVLMN